TTSGAASDAAQREPIEGGARSDLAQPFEQRDEVRPNAIRHLQFGERPAPPARRARPLTDLDPRGPTERRARRGRREHLHTGRQRGADDRVIDDTDPARSGVVLGTDDDQLARRERSRYLVRMIEQTADPAAERPDGRRVRSPDEA